MSVWRIGTKWGSVSTFDLMIKSRIAFWNSDIPTNPSRIHPGDLVVLSEPGTKQILAIGQVGSTVAPMSKVRVGNPQGDDLEEYDEAWAVKLSCLFLLEECEIFSTCDYKRFYSLANDPEACDKAIELFNKHKGDVMVNKLSELLEQTKQIVLTGAPGTGKTFLAWQIASAITGDPNPMGKGNETKLHPHIGFCQFHPSMDYTDFVEGLRPVTSENGQVGFELKDGIFKDFCRRAALGVSSNYEEVWEEFIGDVAKTNSQEAPLVLKTPTGKTFRVFANSNGNLSLMTGEGSEVQGSLTKEKVATFLSNNPYGFWGGYYQGVLEHLANKYKLKRNQENSDQKYVFIIDEINRGDIAKIFGELFFAIDPGYRGDKGRIDTQYGTLIPPGDNFKRFYVPENVYVIGTMNDIDRGVESMDFAIRRRFTWRDIKPEETQEPILRSKFTNDELMDKVRNRMDNLNAEIRKEGSGLGDAYCIGGAYFTQLKVSADGTSGDFDALWKYHLEPLLKEYLRGQETEDIRNRMAIFENTYKNEEPLSRSQIQV